MTTTAAKPDKELRTLVEFITGDPKNPRIYRFTDWTDNVPFDGAIYQSVPEMEIEFAELSSAIVEEKTEIFMPANEFVTRICGLEPHADVQVNIRQLVARADGDSHECYWAFRGFVAFGESNAQNKDGRYLVTCLTWKSLLDLKAGPPATHQCTHEFGSGVGCLFDREAEMRIGTITAIDGTKVTVTGLPARAGTWWNRGTLRIDGLDLQIRHWAVSSPTIFYVVSFPPASWLNASVEVRPGCERTLAKCSVFGQLANFWGFGRKIPKHHPNYEASG